MGAHDAAKYGRPAQAHQDHTDNGAADATVFDGLLSAPGGGSDAKSLLKKEIEQAQVVVAAVEGDLRNSGAGIPEKLAGLEQAQLGLPAAGGNSKLFSEEAVKMARAATAQAGELIRGVVH